MQRWIGLSIFAAGLTIGCVRRSQPAPFTDADASAIRSAVGAMAQAVRDTAFTAWADFYASDAVLLLPNQHAVRGRDAMLRFARAFPPLESFDLRVTQLEGRGDLAFVYGRYAWVVAPPGAPLMPDSGNYVLIWRRQPNGHWKATHDAEISEAPLPASAPAPK